MYEIPRTRHTTRRLRRNIVSGMCAATVGAMLMSSVPAVASAAPAVVEAPLAPQAVVGLRRGTRGSDVKAVQTALVAAGVSVPGGADGIFGPKTQSAVTAFQSRKGLPPSGEVDAATASALGLSTPSGSDSSTGSVDGLTPGAKGDAVKELQQKMMAFGVYVPGGADGIYGPATKTAVSNYQRWNGLAVSGVVDSATATRLGLGGGPSNPAPAAPSTPPASTSSGFSGMKQGARGNDVKKLQHALIAAGISVRGGADGIFGPVTTAALTSFQKAHGLSTSGVLDDASIKELGLDGSSPAPAPTPNPTPEPASPSSKYAGLKVGSQGDLVKELQRALMNTGLTLRGGADGVFGNATKATLILFQQVNGFAQTGTVSGKDASTLGLGSSSGPQGATNGSGYAVFGERGSRVKSLQQALIKAGISFNGGADGVFGASTAGAVLSFQRREGLPATGKVDAATAARLDTAAAPAPAPPSSTGVSIDVFPVQGKCWFGDTWRAPRGGGRTHEGVDIIAGQGNLLYAAVTGTISKMYHDYPGALAGNGFRIAQPNGTYFTYLHLSEFAPGIDVGTKVTAGQVVGKVGSTGNSATPHMHFEVHPNGGGAVNPYPIVKPVDACNITAPRG